MMYRYPNKRVIGRDQMPSLEHANTHTLGGDTNKDATYHALHIRRGDFLVLGPFSIDNTIQ